MNYHALILAAGQSKRFDGIKQLADVHGETLLNRIINEYQKAGVSSLSVALGAYAEQIKVTLADKLNVILVDDWQLGMGYSLSRAIGCIEQQGFEPQDKLVIGLADQIDIDSDSINHLIEEARKHPGKIVASSYNQIIGVPAIFGCDDFKGLSELQKDIGARAYIKRHRDRVRAVEIPSATIDIDTKQDLDSWHKSQKS